MSIAEQAATPRRIVRRAEFWGGETLVALALFAGLALLPSLIEGYVVYILPQYLLFGMLAMSLGLLWGFAGILSFGQAAFFALGAYALGLAMGQWGPAGSYLGLVAAPLLGGGLAALAGYFLFSAGVRATYFVLVTLALSIIVEQIAVSQSQLTGGYNGLFVDRLALSFGSLGALELFDDITAYYFILPVVALAYFLLRWVTTAKFGKVLVGIRENEDRLTALGYDVSLYKTAAFALSGAVAGLAGALYGTHANFVSPSLAGVLFSTEVVVWVAIGGRVSLLGALAGGVIVSAVSNYLSSIIPDYWQLALGIIFILVIIFFKEGFAGAAIQALRAGRRRGKS